MNSITNTTTDAMKNKLQALWIFAMFNYIYADVIGLMNPVTLKQYIAGSVGSLQITEGFLLEGAILMETAIAMVLLSRILKYRENRWANIIAGVIHTAAVSLSMFVGKPALYYVFFGTIEIISTLAIIWVAWKWTDRQDQPA